MNKILCLFLDPQYYSIAKKDKSMLLYMLDTGKIFGCDDVAAKAHT